MSKLLQKFMSADSVDDRNVLLRNDEFLRSAPASGSTPIDMVKVNADNEIEFAENPRLPADPVDPDEATQKGYVDDVADVLSDAIDAEATARGLAITAEAAARTTGDATAATNLSTAIATEVTNRNTAIGVETAARAAADANWSSSAPTGTINGSNTAFTIPAGVLGNTSILLFLNGLLQRYGTDYTRSTTTITFTTAPATGSDLWVMFPKG